MKMILGGAVLAAVFLGFVAVSSDSYANDDLWSQLQEGGKVVVIRHAPVLRGKGNGNSLLRDPSCKKERNLSPEGRRYAKELGERFRKKNIPVEKVLHSPFCRTADTAKLAFGNADSAEFLSLIDVLTPEQAQLNKQEFLNLIKTYKGKGNLVLVTHEPNINAISFELIGYLDVLVIDPDDGQGFSELGVIRFTEGS